MKNRRNFRRSRFDRKFVEPSYGSEPKRANSSTQNFSKKTEGNFTPRSRSSSTKTLERPYDDKGSYQRRSYRSGKSSQHSFNRPVRAYGRSRLENRNFDEIIRFIKSSVSKPKTLVVKESSEPVAKINELVLDNGLLKNLLEKGFSNATPIQTKSIPVVRSGKDILGLANTGTGKTAAYLIPLIENALKSRKKTLILVPTRELAIQIKNEIYLFTKFLPIKSEIVIGGADMYRQIQNLRRNPDFVVGTPGRIKDQKQRGNINIKSYDHIVLDEADRMLDMGFIGEIKELLKERKENVQSLFFSATMDKKVALLINEFCKNYTTIEIEQQKVTDLIDQKIVGYQSEDSKSEKLEELLKDSEIEKSIIFVNTKHRADKLMKQLNAAGFSTDALHGDKSQNVRQKIMRNYKEGRFNHLIATDVAARGIDVKDVTHVINYDVPATVEDYIHRVGRTGRAGKVGVAITLIRD